MKTEIDSALAERLAAGHQAETQRRRARPPRAARGRSKRPNPWRSCSKPIREAVLAHCPSVRFMQEADTRIARVGPGSITWTWAVPVGPDCWGEPESAARVRRLGPRRDRG